MELTRDVFAFAVMASTSLAILLLLECCGTVFVMRQMDDESYASDLVACIDRAKSLDESKACPMRIDAEWGIRRIAESGP